jgi:hypothetical protein
MEKEVLVIVDLKEGKLEKFMGWMQSDEGMSVRKSAAHPEKTIGAVKPDKSGVMFKVFVHNMEKMKEMVSGANPIGKPIYDECVNKMHVWELTKVEI